MTFAKDQTGHFVAGHPANWWERVFGPEEARIGQVVCYSFLLLAVGAFLFVQFVMPARKVTPAPTATASAPIDPAADAMEAEANRLEAAADAIIAGKPVAASGLLSDNQQENVCRAAVGQQFGQSPKILSALMMPSEIVRTSYKRPSDGTTWVNDCRIDGDWVTWRSVTNGAPGRWRNTGNDDHITYRLLGRVVTLHVASADGSTTSESFTL